jgi:ComF family protein
MSILEAVIGLLAPPVCIGCNTEGRTLCASCSVAEIAPFGERCWRCGALSTKARTCHGCRTAGSPRSVWVSTDYDGMAKKLIQKYKFGQQRVAAESLAKLMTETIMRFNSNKDFTGLNYLIVPVPTATSRVRERGFDHAALLAKSIAIELALPCSKALGRLGQARQVGTSRSARLKQAEGSYYVRKPDKISGRNILLVDDVVTTGSTINATSRIMRQAGANHVDAMVFAKKL